MAGEIKFRAGIDARTGEPVSGVDHLFQSLGKIWATHLGSRAMRLDFGSDLRSLLAEDLTPTIALLIYNELVIAAARFEPEYQLTELQLVRLTETGALGIRHAGLYFPEGRLGNYDLAIPVTAEARPLNIKGAA